MFHVLFAHLVEMKVGRQRPESSGEQNGEKYFTTHAPAWTKTAPCLLDSRPHLEKKS